MISLLNLKPLMKNQNGEELYHGDCLKFQDHHQYYYQILNPSNRTEEYIDYKFILQNSGEASYQNVHWRSSFGDDWEIYKP